MTTFTDSYDVQGVGHCAEIKFLLDTHGAVGGMPKESYFRRAVDSGPVVASRLPFNTLKFYFIISTMSKPRAFACRLTNSSTPEKCRFKLGESILNMI